MAVLKATKPRIAVIGVGGAGGNAVNNMIAAEVAGVHFVAMNTDMQALASSRAEHRIQIGSALTEGLGAGAKPEIGEAAAEETLDEIGARIFGAHMVFIVAGMGGGTGTGAAHVVARMAKELGVLTVAVVTKPFHFEGNVRRRNAEAGIAALRQHVDTLLVIPNENLFRVSTHRTTIAEAFVMADEVLYSGLACIIDLVLKDGLIDLDFADVKTVLSGMGTAMIGVGEALGEQRAVDAAEGAIFNPLIDEVSLKGAKSLLLSISGGRDLTLWEVDEAANRVRLEVDANANIIVGATLDESLGEKMRVALVASGMPRAVAAELPIEGDTPDWTPRLQRALACPATEKFGRRLVEAIGERSQKSKSRKKAGGVDAPPLAEAAADTATHSDAPADQPPPAPAKRSGGSRKSGAGAGAVQKSTERVQRAVGGRRGSRKSLAANIADAGRSEFWAAQIAGIDAVAAKAGAPPVVAEGETSIPPPPTVVRDETGAWREPERFADALATHRTLIGQAANVNSAGVPPEVGLDPRLPRLDQGVAPLAVRGPTLALEDADRAEDAQARQMAQKFGPDETKRIEIRMMAGENFAAARQSRAVAHMGSAETSTQGPTPLSAFRHQAETDKQETSLLQRLAGLVRIRREA